MVYYISDLHIGHKNALRFDNRPYTDVHEMEENIIARWNNKVTDNDDVYILGDVFYRYKKDPLTFLSQLKGRIHLITGNHDLEIAGNDKVLSFFESVSTLKQIKDDNCQVVMCHYPIISWNMKHFGTYHVYGHVHANINDDTKYMLKQDRAFNAGCMINNYEPCTLKELEENNRLFKEKVFIQIFP